MNDSSQPVHSCPCSQITTGSGFASAASTTFVRLSVLSPMSDVRVTQPLRKFRRLKPFARYASHKLSLLFTLCLLFLRETDAMPKTCTQGSTDKFGTTILPHLFRPIEVENRTQNSACSADEFPPKYGQKRCTQTTMPNRSVTPYTYVFNNSLTEQKRAVNIRKLFSTYTIIISVYYSCFVIYTWLINAVSPVDALKKGRIPPSIGDDAQGRCVPRCYFFRRSSCRTASRSFSVMVFARITARCPSRLLSVMSALFPS